MKLNLRTVVAAGDGHQLAAALLAEFGVAPPADACHKFAELPGASMAFRTGKSGIGIVRKSGIIIRSIRIPESIAAILYYEDGTDLKSLIFRAS